MIDIDDNPAVLDIPFDEVELAWYHTHLWRLANEVT